MNAKTEEQSNEIKNRDDLRITYLIDPLISISFSLNGYPPKGPDRQSHLAYGIMTTLLNYAKIMLNSSRGLNFNLA